MDTLIRLTLICLSLAACSSANDNPAIDDPIEPTTDPVEQEIGDIPSPLDEISSPPQALVSRLSLDTDFYKQYLDAASIPIVASDRVNPYALLETRWTINNMLINRSDIVNAIASTNTRLAIMAITEFTTDIPEHANLVPADYWDKRARGLVTTTTRPAMSAGEENILNLPGDPYSSESILVHEFAHVVHLQGLQNLDPLFNDTLASIYNQAINEGLWQGTYAASNAAEYFAEGVQSWFGTNRENDSEHNAVNTREELASYDPRLAVLLLEIFGDNPWQYMRSDTRTDDIQHLDGFDRQAAGEFSWPDYLADVDVSQGSVIDSAQPIDPELPRLPNVVAENWNNVTSTSSSTLAQVNFYNQTTSAIRINWVDFEGERIFYFELQPDQAVSASTFADHLWEVERTTDGEIIARFRVQAGDSAAVVE